MLKKDLLFYLVSDRSFVPEDTYWSTLIQIMENGVTCLQFREKSNLPTRLLLQWGQQMKQLAHKYQVPFIVNDRLDLALALEADGLHVGQDDLPASIARKLWPHPRWLGVSASNLEEALEAEQHGADYIGAGAIFPTTTKTDAQNVTLDKLKEMIQAVSIPVVGIGGINHGNAAQVMDAGCAGVAVISCIWGAINPGKAARDMRDLLDHTQSLT
jgi:thiamine-phosphate pyrophosphorylase